MDKMLKFYRSDLPDDFKATYCQHFLKLKNEKFNSWTKQKCVECDVELNGKIE